MTKIMMRDFRACGVCKDARFVFFEKHGLDWRDFVKNGIDVEKLREPGDHLTRIEELEKAAIKREAGNGQK